MENNNIYFNELSEDTIQIYGDINGFAQKYNEQNHDFYRFNISFIKGSKLIKSSTNDRDRSISNIEVLKERIIKIYNDC